MTQTPSRRAPTRGMPAAREPNVGRPGRFRPPTRTPCHRFPGTTVVTVMTGRPTSAYPRHRASGADSATPGGEGGAPPMNQLPDAGSGPYCRHSSAEASSGGQPAQWTPAASLLPPAQRPAQPGRCVRAGGASRYGGSSTQEALEPDGAIQRAAAAGLLANPIRSDPGGPHKDRPPAGGH